jgi:hypothetical protein
VRDFERKDHLISIKPFLLHCNMWTVAAIRRPDMFYSWQPTTVVPARQHLTSRNRPSGLSVDNTFEELLHPVIMANPFHKDPDNSL